LRLLRAAPGLSLAGLRLSGLTGLRALAGGAPCCRRSSTTTSAGRAACPLAAAARLVDILHALGDTPVALELRFDPGDGVSIPLRALTPVAELRQPFDRGFVALEVEPVDQNLREVRRGWLRGSRRLLPASLRRRDRHRACRDRSGHEHQSSESHFRPPGSSGEIGNWVTG
jgi:hypothetical protein